MSKTEDLPELTMAEWRRFSEKIEEDICDAITLEASVNARNATGGTALASVKEEIERAKSGKGGLRRNHLRVAYRVLYVRYALRLCASLSA